MRFTRLLTALVTLALLGFMPIAVTGSADAQAKVARPIPIRGVEKPKGSQKFYIKGTAGLDVAKQKILLQRKIHPGAKWKNFRKMKVNKKGRFSARVGRAPDSKKTCFRAKVKAANGYDTSRSQAVCIVRIVV